MSTDIILLESLFIEELMMENVSLSRMLSVQGTRIGDAKGDPLQGVIEADLEKDDGTKVRVLTYWQEGYLHRLDGFAVECDDAHGEHWEYGKLTNGQDIDGEPQGAVYANGGDLIEFWDKGVYINTVQFSL